MLARIASRSAARTAAAPLRLGAVRALSTDYKGVANPINANVGEPRICQEEPYMYGDAVLEEEKTGFAPGLPLQRDSELWKNPDDPNQLVRTAPGAAPIFFLPRASPCSLSLLALLAPPPCRHNSF